MHHKLIYYACNYDAKDIEYFTWKGSLLYKELNEQRHKVATENF